MHHVLAAGCGVCGADAGRTLVGVEEILCARLSTRPTTSIAKTEDIGIGVSGGLDNLAVVATTIANARSARAINVATPTPFSQANVRPNSNVFSGSDRNGSEGTLFACGVDIDQRDAGKGAQTKLVESAGSDGGLDVIGCRQASGGNEDFHQVGNGSGINDGLCQTSAGEGKGVEGFSANLALEALDPNVGASVSVQEGKSFDFSNEGGLKVGVLAATLALFHNQSVGV